MPYINQEDREKYKSHINDLVDLLTNDGCDFQVGEVNYVISSLIWKLFQNKVSYTNANNLIGVLECVKQEFIRRKLNDYEDGKIVANGDL
jgi:hypothetical protein